MKAVSVIGARPQFIKCAPVSRALRRSVREVLVHTGQHYDDSMSGVFFRELQIPSPDYHLEVGSGPHGQQTGEMLTRIEEVLVKELPDVVVVYGDTNSTLAGALAAAKRHIPVAHVEAGLRSFNRRMPEEINRVLTDHLSDLLLCPTETAVDNLKREGVAAGVHLIGDVMYDALLDAVELANRTSTILDRLRVQPQQYLLATVHRAENTDDPLRLKAIMEAFTTLAESGHIVIFPVHPRTRKHLELNGIELGQGVVPINPVSYLDMVLLESLARCILTDSGGIQKEAFWLQVPCLTLRDETEWQETVQSGWNRLVGTDPHRIVRALEGNGARSRNRWGWAHGEASKNVAQLVCERVRR